MGEGTGAFDEAVVDGPGIAKSSVSGGCCAVLIVPFDENELASDKGMMGSVGERCGRSRGVLGESLPSICCRAAASDIAAKVSDDTVGGELHRIASGASASGLMP